MEHDTLHNHPALEVIHEVPDDHVIVDRKDWDVMRAIIKSKDFNKFLLMTATDMTFKITESGEEHF